MNYEEKTYEEIFEAMLQDSVENGLISHAEDFEDYIANRDDISNYYVMDKSVIAQMFATLYEDLTRIYESNKVEYAESIDLDDIGKLVGINRPPATSAEVEVTFSLSNILEEDVNIEEGVIISTRSGIEYQTLQPIFIAAGEIDTTITCIAVEPGINSKVVENSLTVIVDELPVSLSCINSNPSSGGNEAYTDDEYRYLLMNWTKIRLKGSLEAYEEYFANFEGIDSYRIIPNWNGVTGTVKIVLDPGTDEQLNTAYNDLQNSITQATEDITMFPPIDKYIDIYAIVDVDIDQVNPYSTIEKEEIKARIISAIKIFIDGGYRSDETYWPGLLLGEDFIPYKLGVFLDEEVPELQNITFKYPDDYIQINDEERGVSNDITIEMV